MAGSEPPVTGGRPRNQYPGRTATRMRVAQHAVETVGVDRLTRNDSWETDDAALGLDPFEARLGVHPAAHDGTVRLDVPPIELSARFTAIAPARVRRALRAPSPIGGIALRDSIPSREPRWRGFDLDSVRRCANTSDFKTPSRNVRWSVDHRRAAGGWTCPFPVEILPGQSTPRPRGTVRTAPARAPSTSGRSG